MPYDSASAAAGGLLEETDPVGAAIRRGVAGAPAAAREIAMAEAWCAEDGPAPEMALADLLPLVARDPGAERLQVLAVRLVERMRGRAGSIAAWQGLLERFPRNPDALLVTLRWRLRTEGASRAMQALARAFPEPPADAPGMLLLARCLEELGEQVLADAAFAGLARAHPGFELGWLMHAQAEERRGHPWVAQRILAQARRAVGERPRVVAAARRIETQMAALDRELPPAERAPDGDIGSQLLVRLVSRAAVGRDHPPPLRGTTGGVVILGGSLGAGGAERQMTATTIGLHAAHREGRRLAGLEVGQVELVCRSLTEREGGAFFAPELARHSLAAREYARFAEFGGDPSRSAASGVADCLRFLTPRVAEATARLTDALRAVSPSVVHLWQDGTILACALPAVLARVPRIVLSVRTAPPQDRPERDRPEYALLYPLLARLPGVIWSANSRFAAERYAQCVGLDPARIHVVRNGVAPLRRSGSAAAQAMLAQWQARTGPGFTVGAVIRFDDNKRPLLAIDCFARLLAHRPDARLVLVGDGPLRDAAQAHAAGLGGRVLMTGRSAEVGFWLQRMDALMLLSRCEGLPNVLLEAQLAGVPVVTTPAGGAPETLRHGATGFVLGSAAAPDPNEAVARLLEIADAGGRAGPMARAARRLVAEDFSLSRMLETTVQTYASQA